MKDYRINILVTGVGGIYSAKDEEDAKRIADELCDEIYNRLNGKATVEINEIKEID